MITLTKGEHCTENIPKSLFLKFQWFYVKILLILACLTKGHPYFMKRLISNMMLLYILELKRISPNHPFLGAYYNG